MLTLPASFSIGSHKCRTKTFLAEIASSSSQNYLARTLSDYLMINTVLLPSTNLILAKWNFGFEL